LPVALHLFFDVRDGGSIRAGVIQLPLLRCQLNLQPFESIYIVHALSLPTTERFELAIRHNDVGVEIQVSVLVSAGVPAVEDSHTLDQHRLLVATAGSNPSTSPLAAGFGFIQHVCDALGHVRLSVWLRSKPI